jgi:hypothetical protein
VRTCARRIYVGPPWTRLTLCGADLRGVKLSGANLNRALLYGDFTGCLIYGVSASGLKLSDETKQRNSIVTRWGEPEIAVDNIEVVQFVYLLLDNAKIRKIIDTVGKKGVLLLGRFTEGRRNGFGKNSATEISCRSSSILTSQRRWVSPRLSGCLPVYSAS